MVYSLVSNCRGFNYRISNFSTYFNLLTHLQFTEILKIPYPRPKGGPKVYNIFNGTTMADAVGKIVKIMLARLFLIAILEL